MMDLKPGEVNLMVWEVQIDGFRVVRIMVSGHRNMV